MRNLRASFIASVSVAAIAVIAACGGSSGGPTNPAPPVVPPPAPNPDASLPGRIVYTSVQSGGGLHIYTPATRVNTSLGVFGINPKFSPDGSLIAFQSSPGVKIMTSNGSDVRILDSNFGGVPSFDPTGKIVAFGNRGNGIWKVNIDGSGLMQLTSDGGFQPAWSPDGSRIAYSVTVAGAGQQLFIINADGTGRHQALTSKPIVDVVWRPGPRILFGVQVEDLNYELHSFDPAIPTSLTRLTTQPDNDFEPSWSPDGQHISWSNVAGGLWIMKSDGTAQRHVLTGARQGSWGN